MTARAPRTSTISARDRDSAHDHLPADLARLFLSADEARTRDARAVHRAGAFFAVGLGGLTVDLIVFNLLRTGLMSGPSSPTSKPLVAGMIATASILFNWLGGRYWAFHSRKRTDVGRDFIEYVIVALLGLVVSLVTLATTHYALGLTSPIADTLSKNVLGMTLSSVISFVLLRRWVWRSKRDIAPPPHLRRLPAIMKEIACKSSS